MTVTTSKLTAYGLTGVTAGVTTSKLTAYVLLLPGTEAGGSSNTNQSFTYAQVLRPEN